RAATKMAAPAQRIASILRKGGDSLQRESANGAYTMTVPGTIKVKIIVPTTARKGARSADRSAIDPVSGRSDALSETARTPQQLLPALCREGMPDPIDPEAARPRLT